MQRDPESGLVWSFMNIGEQLDRMNIQLDETESMGRASQSASNDDPSASYPGGDGLMRLSVLNMESKNGLPMYVVKLTPVSSSMPTYLAAVWISGRSMGTYLIDSPQLWYGHVSASA